MSTARLLPVTSVLNMLESASLSLAKLQVLSCFALYNIPNLESPPPVILFCREREGWERAEKAEKGLREKGRRESTTWQCPH